MNWPNIYDFCCVLQASEAAARLTIKTKYTHIIAENLGKQIYTLILHPGKQVLPQPETVVIV